jgi:hypothetical protein
MERFGKTTDPVIAERMAKDCLILPSSGVDLDAVADMADTALATDPNHWGTNFFQFAKGLSEYRQGRFTSAVQWMQKVLAKPKEFAFRDAEASLVLAMARHRLNQVGEARAALVETSAMIDTRPKPASGGLGVDWNDWLMVHALQLEAQALLDTQPPTNSKSPR